MMITDKSIIHLTPRTISNDLQGESIILQLETGNYFGLEGVGNFIWNCLQSPRTVAEIRDAILNEYEVEASRSFTDLMNLLQDLAARQLIEVVNEPS
jgi:hypothetical protein